MPVAIVLSLIDAVSSLITSSVSRFYEEERENLMTSTSILKHKASLHGHRMGKIGLAH